MNTEVCMCACVCVCQTRKQMNQVLTECRGLAREGRTPASWGTYSQCCPWKSGRGDRQCYSDPHTVRSENALGHLLWAQED